MLYAEFSDFVTILDQYFCGSAMCVSGRLVKLCSVIESGLSWHGLPGLANTGWLSVDNFSPFFFYRVQRLYEAETGSRLCLEPNDLRNELW